MSESIQALAKSLQSRFGDRLQSCKVDRGQITIELRRQNQLAVCKALRDESPFNFEQMMDLCGVDYSTYGEAEWITEDASASGFSRGVDAQTSGWLEPVAEHGDKAENTGHRFAAVMQLLSIQNNQRVSVRTFADDDAFPVVDSVISVWSGADWFEREAFDLFGLMFEGHPDLRRLLTDYGFIGHPFRKDFPLIGNVEVRYDEEKKRVIYQPVSIEPRVLVPRVIRGANQKQPAIPDAVKTSEQPDS